MGVLGIAKGRLIVLAWAALLVSIARSGEIKTHHWPSRFVGPQEIPGSEIPVVMDTDVAIPEVSVVGAAIRLQQVDTYTYEGCSTLLVSSNVNVHLSAEIIPTGAMGGDYSCSLHNPDISAPSGFALVCAKLENARRDVQQGFAPTIRVANIKITVSVR